MINVDLRGTVSWLAKLARQHPMATFQCELVLVALLAGYALYYAHTGIDSIGFGDWQELAPNHPYQAAQDGFVLVRTYGGKARWDRDFEIVVASREDQLNIESSARARGHMWDSAISPVPGGSWWRVGESQGEGQIRVFWLPASTDSP